MEQITPSIAQIEELLSEFETQYAGKTNMPLDWVSQYKTFQSHNITIENWNTFNTYIHNVLSDTKSSYEFIINSMNLLFDTFEILNANDVEAFASIENIQDYLETYKDIFETGIIYIPNVNENDVALSTLQRGQLIITLKQATSQYIGGRTVTALQLFQVYNGIYKSVYTADLAYHDLIVKHEENVKAHATAIQVIQDMLGTLDIQNIVHFSDLHDVALSGDYSDLINKPSIPTKVSDLINDSGYITKAVDDLKNYYTKNETVSRAEFDLKTNWLKIKFEVYESVDQLPVPPPALTPNIIYLVGTESPYTEYIYVEGVGYEAIGSTSVDLSNYVQSDGAFNPDTIIVGDGGKKVKDSGFTINSYSNNGILLDADTKIPTSHLVIKEIQKYHNVYTINGDTGTIEGIAYGTNPYFLIVDENLLVYRRIKNDNNRLVYHSQQVLDDGHVRDWYLKFGENDTTNDYIRTYVDNVSHEEFDELVENTPTDVLYNKETQLVQLTHDGMPLGEGVTLDVKGFTPFFDGKGVVLGDVGHIDKNVVTKEYVDTAIANAGVSIFTPIREG